MKLNIPFYLLLMVLSQSCKNTVAIEADSIYFGGTILTMEDSQPSVETLVITNGVIVHAGTKEEAENYIGKNTALHYLEGRTLMPGFIDIHGHLISSAGMRGTVDLSPAPYGDVNNITELQQKLKKTIDSRDSSQNTIIMGNGYDDAIMEEHRHPTRDELDKVSTTIPIIVIHTSGHLSVANGAMLNLLGITENTPNPSGGVYGRNENTYKLNGILEENASFAALIKVTQLMSEGVDKDTQAQGAMKNLMLAQEEWLSYGQTTICDGRTMGDGVALLKSAAQQNLLKADVVYFPDFEQYKKDWEYFLPEYMHYENRLKLGGFKFSNDGSPQGKTAWLTQPYLVPPAGQTIDYKGFPIFEDEVLYEDLKTLFNKGVTAQLHVNGDAAIDQAIRVIERLKEEGIYKTALRATLIHVQNSRPDHIEKIKNLGIIPSYFSTHAYLWGDWHYSSVFGPERASFISPANSALKSGIPFTIHHDAPVTPPDLMTAVYAAVNRKTRSGRILGENERISPLDALKAITINAAYQYQEEDRKGSLKVGKLADLVILNENPLLIEPEQLKDILVLETIKEGKTVYLRKQHH